MSATVSTASLDKKRWFYLALFCLINVCAGTIFTWSVFAPSLAKRLTLLSDSDVSVGDLAMIFGLANSIGPLPMIAGGFLNDRFGPKLTIGIGSIMMGAGLYLCGEAHSYELVLVSYGVLFASGLAFIYGCTINNSIKLFPDRRGLAGGLATAFYGLSSVIAPVIANRLITDYGVDFAFKAFSICTGSIILVCALATVKPPAGYLPAGFVSRASIVSKGDKNWRQMTGSPTFLPLMFFLTCGAVSAMMILSQTASIAKEQIGMTSAAASTAVAILALLNTFGRLLAGYMSDLFGRIRTLVFAVLLTMAGLCALLSASDGNATLFFVAVAAVGFAFGSFMAIFPGLTADEYGSLHNSVNYSIMFIGFSLAGFLGPFVMRQLHTPGQSYGNSYLVAIVFSALGLAMALLYLKISSKERKNRQPA